MAITLLIDVLKELLPGELLTGPNDLGEAPVAYAQRRLFAAFTSEAETDLVSLDGHVPVLQRGQAIAVVLPGLSVIPYTYQRGLQEMHDGYNNFFPRQTAQCHVLAYCFPNGGQGVCKCDHMLVLRAFRTSRKRAW
jgi:hypothetical protein